MDYQTQSAAEAPACQCGKPYALGFAHRATEPCLGVGEAPLGASMSGQSEDTTRFFTRLDRSGRFEVLGTATGDGARIGRDEMIVYCDLDTRDLLYCSKPDFDSRMVPTDRFTRLDPPTPLRVTRWEKRVNVDSNETAQKAAITALVGEVSDYRRIAAQYCDPLHRYLRAYRIPTIDTTRVTRYGPNYWAAGADDEFGPRDEGEFVKLGDIHELVERVAAVTPDAILQLLHDAANTLETLGHVAEAKELDRRIIGATSVGRAPVGETPSASTPVTAA